MRSDVSDDKNRLQTSAAELAAESSDTSGYFEIASSNSGHHHNGNDNLEVVGALEKIMKDSTTTGTSGNTPRRTPRKTHPVSIEHQMIIMLISLRNCISIISTQFLIDTSHRSRSRYDRFQFTK